MIDALIDDPGRAVGRVERNAGRAPDAIGVVAGELAARSEERIVAGRGAVRVETEQDIGVVGRAAANRVLGLAGATGIATGEVELAIGSKRHGAGLGAGLRADWNAEQHLWTGQRGAAPGVAIDARSQRR